MPSQTIVIASPRLDFHIWNKHRHILALHSIHPYTTPYTPNTYTVQAC